MIPNFDDRGLLPAGVHDAGGFAEVAAVFAFNQHRTQLLGELQRFIALELQHVATGLELIVGGSFLTTKAIPGDIDCTVLIPLMEVGNRGALLNLLITDGGKSRIWKEYRVEAYPSLMFPGQNDFSAYFQYVGDKSALIHNCSPTDRRGVIKIDPWTPG